MAENLEAITRATAKAELGVANKQLGKQVLRIVETASATQDKKITKTEKQKNRKCCLWAKPETPERESTGSEFPV